MSFLRLMFQLTAPGGTARWAAKHYALMAADGTDYGGNAERMREMLLSLAFFRYATLPHRDSYRLSDKILTGEIRGLLEFVVEIQRIEGGLGEATPSVQATVYEAVSRELVRKGVPNDIITGSRLHDR